MKKATLLLIATCLLLAVSYLVGLAYCASTHGLGYYGTNRGNSPSLPHPVLQRLYNPSLRALALYYEHRAAPFPGFDDPIDVVIVDRVFLDW